MTLSSTSSLVATIIGVGVFVLVCAVTGGLLEELLEPLSRPRA